MSTTVFDTLAYAKRLKAAGVPEAQAEAQARVRLRTGEGVKVGALRFAEHALRYYRST